MTFSSYMDIMDGAEPTRSHRLYAGAMPDLLIFS
jgi:hypothetical protein